ncbi:transporter substrate-binding domain-containing protein [Alphaproteobacteria bacterium]|nr:transporter substrate-binding domain-containing protein [Alphaproteobacteria bacterium]
MNEAILTALAPHGELRAAINMSNFLLVSGRSADGGPDGLSPDLAKEIARRLGVPCRLVPFEGPGQLADAVGQDIWDIGNIALEPERAQTIDFSTSYIKIDANFLVRNGSSFTTNAEIDKPGVEIILYNRSAYDLWLKENFSHPDFLRVASIKESHEIFYAGMGDVLASLKPRLLDELANIDGYRVIEQPFTSINQSIGIQKGHSAAVVFLNSLIAELSGNGFIEQSLKRHGVEEKLSMVTF